MNSKKAYMDLPHATKSIGVRNIVDLIFDVLRNPDTSNLPFVSIGSGNGCIESMIENKLKKRKYFHSDYMGTTSEHINTIKWICIDPNPLSCAPNKNLYKEPDYQTVYDLIKDKPELIGNCNLFIMYALPTMSTIHYVLTKTEDKQALDTPYDYDAIQVLRPKSLISMYELFFDINIAGSDSFRNWIDDRPYLIHKSIKAKNRKSIKKKENGYNDANTYVECVLLYLNGKDI